jgi:hypothetical protein
VKSWRRRFSVDGEARQVEGSTCGYGEEPEACGVGLREDQSRGFTRC